MRDTNRNDQVHGDGPVEPRLDRVGESGFVAMRVGNDEKPPVWVEGARRPLRADTHARDYERCRGTQDNDHCGCDSEPDPARRRWINRERGDESGDEKKGGDRRKDEREIHLRAYQLGTCGFPVMRPRPRPRPALSRLRASSVGTHPRRPDAFPAIPAAAGRPLQLRDPRPEGLEAERDSDQCRQRS